MSQVSVQGHAARNHLPRSSTSPDLMTKNQDELTETETSSTPLSSGQDTGTAHMPKSTQSRTFVLAGRRSVDFSSISASQGQERLSLGPSTPSTGASRYRTVATSAFSDPESHDASNKRTRGMMSGLSSLFNQGWPALNANSVGFQTGFLKSGTADEREAVLMEAVQAAQADDIPWKISVQTANPMDRGFLHYSSPNISTVTASSTLSNAIKATNAAGRLFSHQSSRKLRVGQASSGRSKIFNKKRQKISDEETEVIPDTVGKSALLVLYVTTGTRFLTLYRSLQDLIRLDEAVGTLKSICHFGY